MSSPREFHPKGYCQLIIYEIAPPRNRALLRCSGRNLGACDLLPRLKSSVMGDPVLSGFRTMTARAEEIVDPLKLIGVMNMNQQRTRVFISYSREDEEVVKRLCKHLRSMTDEELLKLWLDVERIDPGDRWEEKIKKALEETAVAITLVSADFLESEFVSNIEIPALVEAAHDGVSIVPVIVKPSTFQHSPLSPFQSINRPEEPLVEMSEREK